MTMQDVLAALQSACEPNEQLDALVKSVLPAHHRDIEQPTQSCDAAMTLMNRVLTSWRMETLEQCLDYHSGALSWHCLLRQYRQRDYYKAEDTKAHEGSNAATPALAILTAMFQVLDAHHNDNLLRQAAA